MAKKKRRFEWTTRPDGKRERWEFRSDISRYNKKRRSTEISALA